MGRYNQDLKDEIGKLKQDPWRNVQTLTNAGQNAEKGLLAIADGVMTMQNGNSYGGAAKLVEGIGQLSNALALGGPELAAAGAVLSIITGIISAVLQAINPLKEKSLESKIEDIEKEQEMRKMRHDLAGDEETWEEINEEVVIRLAFTRKAIDTAKTKFVFDSKTMFIPEGYSSEIPTRKPEIDKDKKFLVDGVSLEHLKTLTNLEKHLTTINDAFQPLNEYKNLYSVEWGSLADKTVGYMFRFWVSIYRLKGVIDQNGYGLLDTMLSGIRKNFKDHLDELEYASKNNSRLYARWHGGNTDYLDTAPQSIYWRVGVVGKDLPDFKALSDKLVGNFAVSTRGTVFSSVRYRLGSSSVWLPTAGRGADWAVAKGEMGLEQKWAAHDNQEVAHPVDKCEQIYIGEVSHLPDSVIVACTHGGQHELSICTFNDKEGFGEAAPNEWTPNEKRWGVWKDFQRFEDFKIASVAIAPVDGKYYIVYALGLNYTKDVKLYQLLWDGGLKAVEDIYWSSEEVANSGALNLLEAGKWSPYPAISCAISLSPFAVQLGSRVKIRTDKGIVNWDLRDPQHLNDKTLKVHQGRFYDDGTFVLCSNRGLHMLRDWNPPSGAFEWEHDPIIETDAFQKVALQNGGLYRVLQQPD